jgi:uncharacterized membrane protein HdeD (DUF308 family)
MEASPRPPQPDVRSTVKDLSRLWWLWLVFGLIWTAIAVVILQFDDASITTVGIIIGLMFFATGLQSLVGAVVAERHGWVYGLFAILFFVAGVVSVISPENTFEAIADILGFLFLIVGIFWIIEAFAAKEVNPLWWLGLVAGILMVALAFYTGGQFFIEKAYVLLVFAGIWALMNGITDIMRAFQIRRAGRLV